MITNNVKAYTDAIIIDALLNEQLIKVADEGLFSNLVAKIQEYLRNNHLIDSDNKLENAMKIMEPEFIYIMLSAIGFPWLGMAAAVAINVFDIDVHSIFKSVFDAIVPSVKTGEISDAQIDAAAQHATEALNSPIPEDEGILSKMKDSIQNLAKKYLGASYVEREIRFLKLSVMTNDRIVKNAIPGAALIARLFAKKTGVLGFLAKAISWIFKAILGALGFNVLGNAGKKMLGKPNAFDGPLPTNPSSQAPVAEEPKILPRVIPKQKKFPPNPSYSEVSATGSGPWIESYPNNDPGIEQMLIAFTKEVYKGLESSGSVIRSSSIFQKLVDNISNYNRSASGSPFTFVPKNLNSKKQIVDYFIDDVASKSP